MRDTAECAAQRLDSIRYARAYALLSPLRRHLLRLISILLHHHSELLPGYNGPFTPSGIIDFAMDIEDLEACETLNLDINSALHQPNHLIEGVYSMGSTASFGQNSQSDVDVWLVHNKLLSQRQCQLLNQKTSLLTQWFAGFDFEVNIYLVHPEQFLSAQADAVQLNHSMGHEHSGSAQHWLLLEEFYRSHFRLAGKVIAWWPNAQENKKQLTLGDPQSLPASEYFGASLWQLYKGVDKPHKALLKVLLLEAYASEYPHTQLVSDCIWKRTLEGDFSAENDAYYLLYKSIETYLLKKNDLRRLELTRRCFYLKCGVRLSMPEQAKDWRYFKIEQLKKDWQWSQSLVETLDNCEHWHCGQLQWFNEQLNELMLGSYQTLLHFASSHELSENLRVSELGLLTRKLHTYFSEDEQQVMTLNPLWSRSLSERHLSIIHSEQDGQYYLYRCTPHPKNFLNHRAVYHTKSRIKLLVWAAFNGVSVESTHWYEVTQNKQRAVFLTAVSKQLAQRVGIASVKVSQLALCQPWHIKGVIFLLNFSHDPTAQWRGQDVMADYLNSNIFSVGRNKTNMLGSIDVITSTSWGELHCHHFEGDSAILEALMFVAPGMKRATEKINIEVVSCGCKLKSHAERSVKNLLDKTERLSHTVHGSSTLVYPLQVGQVHYGIFFNSRGMYFENLSDAKSLYQQLSKRKLIALPRPEMSDEPFSMLPTVIQDYAATGVIQYFLRQRDKQLDVFILDEDNGLNYYVQDGVGIEALVSDVSHYYAFNDLMLPREQFNMPQFFKLEREQGRLLIVPFGVSQELNKAEF